MREIGTIGRERDAKALADYLLTLDISTKLVPRADGSWAVWVHKEDRIPQARQVLDRFVLAPEDPYFRAAAPAAKEIRKKAERAEADYRKRVRDLRDRWEGPIYRRAPLTFALVAACIGVYVLDHLDERVYPRLTFSALTVDAEGFPHDSGLAEIRRGEVWRLVTPIFLHGGVMHLVFNVLALRSFGERIEMRKGAWRLALFVLVTAVASNCGEFARSGGNFLGISGVVFAMAGYLWVKGQADPGDGLSLDQRTMNFVFGWFLLGVVAGELGPPGARGFPFNMANVAHGVGLASGMALGILRL